MFLVRKFMSLQRKISCSEVTCLFHMSTFYSFLCNAILSCSFAFLISVSSFSSTLIIHFLSLIVKGVLGILETESIELKEHSKDLAGITQNKLFFLENRGAWPHKINYYFLKTNIDSYFLRDKC